MPEIDTVFGLKLISDTGRMVTSSLDSFVSVFDLVSHHSEARLQNHSESVLAMDFDENCDLLVTGSHDKSICVFELSSLALKHQFQNATKSHFRAVKLISGENKFFAATSEGDIQLWDMKTKWRIKEKTNAHSSTLLKFHEL